MRFLYSICIWKCIPTATIRYEERAFDNLHLLLANCIFPREISQGENIILLYFEGIWRSFENFLSKSNKKTTPYSPHNVFFSFLTKWASNVRMFRYTLLKWMNYKNRLVFAYYNILRFYCFKIPISRYFFQ